MHPEKRAPHLDAIYFSPHKFLGGPGTPGVLISIKRSTKLRSPISRVGGHRSIQQPMEGSRICKNIEQGRWRHSPFLGGIKVAMCVRLKESMGVENMLKREEEMLLLIFNRFSQMKNVEILEGNNKKRLV